MTFVDRLFLANYSINALSAMSSAGTLAFSLTFGVQNLTLIASIFVAQLNGAKKYQELGAPVWQMFWFALATYVMFIPLAFVAKYFLFLHSPITTEQNLMFKCIMLISPLFAIVASLQSFYNGQGKTVVITYLSIIGNLVNVILAPLLIFGYKDIVPSLGIIGAITATAIGLGVQIVIFMALFLSARNRRLYGTNRWRINMPLFKACLRIGSPDAAAFGIEILCWAVFYNMMASLSQTHIVVAAIAQSVSLLFFFFVLSLGQGTAIVAGNLIGANRKQEIKNVFYAGCVLTVIYTLVMLFLFHYSADLVIKVFFYKQINLEPMNNTFSIATINMITPIMSQVLSLLAVYLGFEAARFMINGLLKAAGDTVFLLIIGVINVCLFLILPTYIAMIVYKMPVEAFIKIWLFFAFMSAAISYVRFYRGDWQRLVIMK